MNKPVDSILKLIDTRILEILNTIPIKERDGRIEELINLKSEIIKNK